MAAGASEADIKKTGQPYGEPVFYLGFSSPY